MFEDYRVLADILMGTPGREDEGLAVLEQALELPLSDIQKANIIAEIAWFLYELGRMERATSLAHRALTQIAGQAETPEGLMVRGLSHATVANCQYSTDRASSDRAARLALEAFEQLLSEYPHFDEFAGACRYAARLYVLREEYTKAVTHCEQSMRADSSERNRLYALICLGTALRCQGRYGEAQGRLKEALALVEADKRCLPMIHFELGKVYRLANIPEEAVLAFEQALTALGTSRALREDRDSVVQIKWELGNAYYDMGRYDEAVPTFQEVLPEVLEIYPYLYWNTLISLGHCYLATGQYAKARDCYEEVAASEQASRDEKAVAQEALSALPPLPPPRPH